MINHLLILILLFLGCSSNCISQILSENQEITYLSGNKTSIKKEKDRMLYIFADARPHYIIINSEPFGSYQKKFDMYNQGINSDGNKIYYCKDSDTGLQVNFVIHEDVVVPYLEKISIKNGKVSKITRYYYED